MITENFFGTEKYGERRGSARKNLGQDLETYPPRRYPDVLGQKGRTIAHPISMRKFLAGIMKQFPGNASTFPAFRDIW
jgi:hypothetical protein